MDGTTNLKHKAILATIYSAGLRVSELLNLKIKDIDSNSMLIRIEQSKGKRDRYVVLSEKLLLLLRDYFKHYHPKIFLFEGQSGGQYSARSIQVVFKNCVLAAKIDLPVSVHTLRHCFATHLIESGTDVRFVQELLGHASIRTTMIYTHLTDLKKRKIKSPFDAL
jgi:site-specific recombinase XerD